MDQLTKSFLLIYVALLPIINPVGDAPIFLELTQFCTPPQRNDLARRVAFNSFLLLVGSLLVGSHVLGLLLGISLPVVRIGGGIVVTALGWKLLNAEAPPRPRPGCREPVRANDPGLASIRSPCR